MAPPRRFDLSGVRAVFGLLGIVVLGGIALAGVTWAGARVLDAIIDDPDDEDVTTSAIGPADAEDYELAVDVCEIDEGRAVASGSLRNTAGEERIFLIDVVFRDVEDVVARTPAAVQVGPLDDGEDDGWFAQGGPTLEPVAAGQELECDPVRVARAEEVVVDTAD